MRTYRSKSGRFLERPFFKPDEIEQICSEELRKAELYPSDPAPIRIDRFVEKRFRISVSYQDLPPGLLGFTEFNKDGVEAIVIAKSLDDEGSRTADRRVRTTLGHESGHGLLHTRLMILGDETRSLFDGGLEPDRPRILCRNDSLSTAQAPAQSRYNGQWWEFQANQVMGALLLPSRLVEKALDRLLVARGHLGTMAIEPSRRVEAVSLLAETFDVNPVVARYRLEGLYPETDLNQLTL